MSDLKSKFLAIQSAKIVPVQGAEGFFVKELTAGDRDRWEKSIEQPDPRSRTIIISLCDADGNLVFGKNDSKEVGQIPASLADAVLEAFQVAKGVTAEEADAIEGN